VLWHRRQDESQSGLGYQENLEAFGARLQPILAEVGINPGPPEIFPVHNIIKG
jgi:hypothetical protein